MLDVKVLGSGCANCQNTSKLVKQVAQDTGVEIQLEKVEDFQEIMKYDVMSTPGVVINGKVVHRGSVPSEEQIKSWLTG